MIDSPQEIFGNPIHPSVNAKASRAKKSHQKAFGDDSSVSYPLTTEKNPVLGPVFGVRNIIIGEKGEPIDPKKSIVIGNIRMGFGHYRIAMSVASAAKAKGLTPYWFDLLSFKETTGGKVIGKLNDLYSLGSRLSQKFPLFDKFYWEPLNSEGFKKLEYNAGDQKTSELMTTVFKNLPKDIPFVGTHAWPSQAAVHAGMTNVINMIPDNWPMALHLAEGSLHTIQCPSSYMGYRMLREFGGKKTALKMIPENSLEMVGHYVDEEIVANIEKDCEARLKRIKTKATRRLLLSVGGAGAQKDIFVHIIRKCLPDVKSGKLSLFLNVGDHKSVWDGLVDQIPELKELTETHFDDWKATESFCKKAIAGRVEGIHAFWHSDIFAAVYSTNLLMRACDVLATKPSELSFYPVPKLFIKRIGGHEAWGAIRGAELGDGSFECDTVHLVEQAYELLFAQDAALAMMCEQIMKNAKIGIYNGARRVVELALERKKTFKKK